MGRSGFRASVSEVDRGWKAFRRAMRDADAGQSYVKVGVLDEPEAHATPSGDKGSDTRDGITNAELAAVHEFGSRDGRIPERSFIRSTYDAKLASYKEDLKKLVKGIYEQKVTIERALGIMGAKMSGDMKRAVTSGAGIPPPNAPSTLRAKLGKGKPGSKKQPRPLIDTGRLIGALTWLVLRVQGK